MLSLAAGADRSDPLSFRDSGVATDTRRAKVGQRHREAVRRLNRDPSSTRGNRPRPGDRPCRRCNNRLPGRTADVDAAVLPGRVRVGTEDERLQHRPLHRPRPRRGRGRARERSQADRDQRSPQGAALCCPSCQHSGYGTRSAFVLSTWTTKTCRKGPCARGRSLARSPPPPGVVRLPRRRARQPRSPPRSSPPAPARPRPRPRA